MYRIGDKVTVSNDDFGLSIKNQRGAIIAKDEENHYLVKFDNMFSNCLHTASDTFIAEGNPSDKSDSCWCLKDWLKLY